MFIIIVFIYLFTIFELLWAHNKHDRRKYKHCKPARAGRVAVAGWR